MFVSKHVLTERPPTLETCIVLVCVHISYRTFVHMCLRARLSMCMHVCSLRVLPHPDLHTPLRPSCNDSGIIMSFEFLCMHAYECGHTYNVCVCVVMQ